MVGGAPRRPLERRRIGEINVMVPLLVVAAGLLVAATGRWSVGAGLAVGAVLAYGNSLLLVSRIELAASTGNVGAAMISMHVGLLVTFTLAAAATVAMLQISVAMTVAMAVSFFVSQTVILVWYYFERRGGTIPEVVAGKGDA